MIFVRPFLKWAGGKTRLVDRIKEKLAANGTRLIEPFAGSCALSLNCDRYERYWLNDVNKDLINLYLALRDNGNDFIDYCHSFFTAENNTSERYYEFRETFNATTDVAKRSAIFLYLNRHGFNGLCRYNNSGGFNVPFGKYKAPYFPQNEMEYFSRKFAAARFTCLDFRAVMLESEVGDVVYCDPPYVPISDTASFTEYSTGGFGLEDQKRLAEYARELSERGVVVIISNHHNSFTSEIYRGALLDVFSVQRFISCDGRNRNSVDEVLAVFNNAV
ncbi:MAG: Dam family site-specific DNA-(adenine-N6)-methyltransferase [Negativicutes bacterium]